MFYYHYYRYQWNVNYPPPTLRLEVGASKVVVPNGTTFT